MSASKMEKRDRDPEAESLLQYLRGKVQIFTVF